MALVNYSSDIIQQAGRPRPTIADKLAPVAQGIAGASQGASAAIRNFVLSRGGEAIETGIKELQAANLSNPTLEQWFRQVDPTDPEAVKFALDKMGQLVTGARGDTEAMSIIKGAGGSREQALATAQAEATRPGFEAVQSRLGSGTAAGYRGKSLEQFQAEQDARARSKLDVAKGMQELGQTDSTVKMGVLASKTMAPALEAMAKAGKNVESIIETTTPYQEAYATAPGLGEVAKGELAKSLRDNFSAAAAFSPNADYLASIGVDDGTLKVSFDKATGGEVAFDPKDQAHKAFAMRQWRADAQRIGADAGQMVADYMKSISGAAISQQEMERLQAAMGYAYGTSPATFYHAVNTMMDKIWLTYNIHGKNLEATYNVPGAEKEFGSPTPATDWMRRVGAEKGPRFPVEWTSGGADAGSGALNEIASDIFNAAAMPGTTAEAAGMGAAGKMQDGVDVVKKKVASAIPKEQPKTESTRKPLDF